MDWDMIVGYDFMMDTDSGVLQAQASMTLYQDSSSRGFRHLRTMWSANGSTRNAISSKQPRLGLSQLGQQTRSTA